MINRLENSAPFIIAPVAASISIVPVFYGYMAKTAKQLGKPCPSVSSPEFRINLVKAIPTFGAVVGVQLAAHTIVQNILFSNKEASLSSLMTSSMIVGAVAAPPLALFNGQSANLNVKKSIQGLSVIKVLTLAARQTSFLMGMTVGDHLSRRVKLAAGDSRVAHLSCVFFSGALGSILGHPADTLVTLWQNGQKVNKFSDVWRGGLYRSMAVGSYAVIYNVLYEYLISTKKSSE